MNEKTEEKWIHKIETQNGAVLLLQCLNLTLGIFIGLLLGNIFW